MCTIRVWCLFGVTTNACCAGSYIYIFLWVFQPQMRGLHLYFICLISDPSPLGLWLQSQSVFSSPSVQSQISLDTADQVKQIKNSAQVIWVRFFSYSAWKRFWLFFFFCRLQHSFHSDSSCYCSTRTPIFPGNRSGLQCSICCPAACL